MSATFDLHGIVQITVSDRVHRNIKASVRTQLASLDATSGSTTPAELLVEPYDVCHLGRRNQSGGPAVTHESNIVDFPGRDLAVAFGQDQITLYLNVSGVPINPWLQLLLVRHGVTMVHAAAVERNGKVLLLPAFGGAGKTLAVGLLVRDYGYRFLGDDIVLLREDGLVFSFPRPLFFYDHHLEVFGDFFSDRAALVARYRLFGRLKRQIVKGFPAKALVRSIIKPIGLEGLVMRAAATREYVAAARPDEVFPGESLGVAGDLAKIAFLQRYGGNDLHWERSDTNFVATRMFAILHNEWTAEWPQIVAAAGHGLIDLPGYYASVSRIMRNGLKNAAAATLMIPEVSAPHGYVEELIQFESR